MFFRNDSAALPYPLQLPGCALDCPLEDFVRITKFSISDDRRKECQLPTENRGHVSAEDETTTKECRLNVVFFHFQKWSSAWCWLAACCWSSSSFYSASSAARRSRWGARGTRRWSTRRLGRTPDTSTDSCLGDPQASPPGKAATTLSFKLFQDICDIFINWLWKLILKFQFGFGSKVLETKGTWLQGWNCLTAQLTGCFFSICR